MLGRDAQNRLLFSLGPLGEQYFSNAEQMRKAGFGAFEPLMQFEQSFCANPEQQALHHQIIIEAAKETIGNAAPYHYMRDESPQGYRSALLEQLRRERIARGEAFVSYDPLKPWRYELDCCKRARIEFEYAQHAEFKARQSGYLDEHRRLRHREVEFHATAWSLHLDRGTFEKPLRVDLCKEVLAQVMGPHGFAHDRRRSSRSAIVFSKALVANWAVSWVIDLANLFSVTETAFLDITLELRDSEVKGLLFDSDSHQGRCVPVAYEAVTPTQGWSYARFASPPELETVLRAHLFAYALIAEKVEAVLASGLTSELNPPADEMT